MKAKDFFEEQIANMRELWHLRDLQKEMVYILMERYAELRIADVVGRSEQLVCYCQGCGEEKKIEYCEKCYAENLPDLPDIAN